MGFISNVVGTMADSISSEIKDQYLESFRTDSLGQTMLVKESAPLNTTGLNQGSSDVISAGSKILVPEGTYAIMVDNGQVIDSATTPGVYTWKNSSSGLKSIMADAFDRFRFAGEVTKCQKLYYVNGLEIMNQTYSNFLQLPYHDPVYGNLYLKFRVMFSFRIVDPVVFFKTTGKETNVLDYMGSTSSPKMPFMELKDHMEEALNLCATRDKVPFPKLISNKNTLKKAVNEALSKHWRERRGMVIESIALNDLSLDEASRARVEQVDSAQLFSDDPAALKALYVLGFTNAMKTAAANPAGASAGLAGIGMAVPETCPYCGSPLPSLKTQHCPACAADLRS